MEMFWGVEVSQPFVGASESVRGSTAVLKEMQRMYLCPLPDFWKSLFGSVGHERKAGLIWESCTEEPVE